MSDHEFAETLAAAFPAAPKEYHNRILETIEALRLRDRRKAKKQKIGARIAIGAAASLAAVLAVSGCTFSVRPALAAEIPVVNSVVYALAQTVAPDAQKTAEIERCVTKTAKAMMTNDREALEALLYRPERLSEEGDITLALSYLRYRAMTEEWIESRVWKDAATVSVQETDGTQKAFRYEVRASIVVTNKDAMTVKEPVRIRLIENVRGIFLEEIELSSSAFSAYAQQYRSGRLIGGTSAAATDVNNAYFSYVAFHKNAETTRSEKTGYLLRLLEQIALLDAPESEKARAEATLRAEIERLNDVKPETLSYEELAAELMYRYHLGRVSGEASDFSDLVERNAQTDLFLYDAQLAADRIRLGFLSPVESVGKGTAETVRAVTETEETITVELLVYTDIRQGITKSGAEDIFLTFAKDTGKIIGYDRAPGDGVYLTRLKPLAEAYRRQGMSWEEADEAAYQQLLDEVETYMKNR